MTTGDRTYDANASVIEQQVQTLQASAGGFAIYREGGVTSGNVYNTLLGASDAVRGAGGGKVLVDGTLGQPTTQATTYDFKNVELSLGFWDGGPFTLDVVPGTVIANLERVGGGLYINNKATAPVMSVAAGKSAEVWFLEGAGVLSDTGCSAPFFKALAGSTLYLYLGGLSQIDGLGHHAVLEAAATSTVNIVGQPLVVIGQNTLTGPGDITVVRGLGIVVWATVDPIQTGATPTIIP